MNLPIFNQLLSNSSTYITFSKSLVDMDIAKQNGTEFFYSKMVALKLPFYAMPDFFIDLTEVDITSTNPNTTIPKGMQYYMENIIRQNTGSENIVELAFYKFLHKCGLSYSDIHDSINFVNKIATSNFTKVNNNNGWCEVVGVIPNRCLEMTKIFKENDIADIIPMSDDDGDSIFDNGNKEFLFNQDDLQKQTIDFDNIIYHSDSILESFDFNVLLFFYRDAHGIDKLHGINFINPFENKITHYELPLFTQKFNDSRSIGYQFKINLKTVNNEASLIMIEEYNTDAAHWNTYFETLSGLNSLLHLNELGQH